jgi:hypothetical protein
MAHYKIKATYLYEGTVEADSQKEAEKVFIDELNDHFISTDSYKVEEVEKCEDCEKVFDNCSCND